MSDRLAVCRPADWGVGFLVSSSMRFRLRLIHSAGFQGPPPGNIGHRWWLRVRVRFGERDPEEFRLPDSLHVRGKVRTLSFRKLG